MKRLIINADDLGLTPGINRAIFELSDLQAITSATLMASAPQTNAAALQLANHSSLGVGCHVVLVDGTPVLAPSQIPTLIVPHEPQGSFRPTLGPFVRDLLLGRIREHDIEAEAVAQIRALQASGVAVTHIDTHKHTHMFPRVLRPILRAALICGVRAVRNPFEPDWGAAATSGASFARRIEVTLLRSQRAYFLSAVRRSGLRTTDGAIGVLATGTLDAATLRTLLATIPEGTWELVCHPGYVDRELKVVHTHLVGSRETERQSLLEVVPKFADGNNSLSLVNFANL